MTTCAIIQSSYIPWRGYFDLIRQADVFVFLDSVQFTRRDWRTRNYIKSNGRLISLIVPVNASNHHEIRISDIDIDPTSHWAKKHLHSIETTYARAPFRDVILESLRPVYENPPKKLFLLNRALTQICWDLFTGNAPKKFLGDEQIDFGTFASPTDRIVQICRTVGATKYLSGPSAASYTDPKLFSDNGIVLEYAKYDYLPYSQLHGPFQGAVSIIDVLFNLGPNCADQALAKVGTLGTAPIAA